jgi:3-hydroxyisobutyrate dehydrogenase-like beta-hydroxyacid dehydrogenase
VGGASEEEREMSLQGRRVGFIGLGRMGGPMATHLLRAGATMTVRDVAPEAVERLVGLGATAADSPADVGRASDVVFVMLHPAPVEEVIAGTDGVLDGIAPGGIIVDSGNSNPTVSRRLAETCAARGVAFLDAGASGGPAGSAAGTLAVMVGGDPDVYESCLPYFNCFGREVAYMGPSGSGHLAKIVNNMIVGMTAAVVSEALSFAEANGLAMPDLTRVIATGAARSWVLENAARLYTEPLPPGWESWTGRPAANQLTWALEQAVDLGFSLPITGVVHEFQKLGRLPEPPPAALYARKLAWRFAGVPETVKATTAKP